MLTKRLQNSLNNFIPDLESEKKRENDRILFIKKFPLDKIKDLNLDDFAAGGGNKDSFCYWLEFKNILFGIGGGNASKFGIYKSNKNNEYYSSANKSSVVLSDEKLPIYFNKLKSEIVLALELTNQNRIVEIENVIETSMWKIVLLKILTIYYPDKFLQIGSFDTLLNIATDFELNEIINPLDKDNIFVVNYELNKVIRKLEQFNDWNSFKISDFIWKTYENKSNNNYYLLGSKYSNDGNFKDVSEEMVEKEVVSIGFASDHDLSEYYGKSQKDITSYLKEINENKNSYNALKHFLNLKVGDRIAIKSNGSPKGKIGNLTIIGYANVIDKDGTVYTYDKNGLGHMINVKHEKLDKELNLQLGGYGSTIHKLSDKEQINKIFYSLINLKNESDKEMRSLNIILYGPPGTGKTYNTILRAAQISTGNFNINYEDAKIEFKSQLEKSKDDPDKQIEFITFHQNYSYEDFIQGLRPDVEVSGGLSFKKEDGVFKRIADRALENLELNSANKLPFETVFRLYFKDLKAGIVPKITVKMKRVSYEITEFTENRIPFTKNSGGTAHYLRVSRLKEMYINESVGEQKGLVEYYEPLLNEFLELDKKTRANAGNAKKNYVIIIDEINRANISRVFGELITLIEDDKRSHGDIPMRATLPSGDTFMVPSNLYIIGTMNTADKSIALLDIALRRRFTFVGMYPKYEIEDEIIHEKEYLRKINEKIIESGKGRDFQLGHSYFMGKEFNLVSTLNNKVIPLLMEYFMNDEVTVIKLLEGSGFLFKKEASGKVYWPLEIESVKEEDGN